MSDGYGAKQSELFESLDPVGSCLKTRLASCLCQIHGACSVTWRERVTRFGQWYWAPTIAGRRTDGNGSGLLGGWPTPNAAAVSQNTSLTCSGDGMETPNKLGWAVVSENWNTPTSMDADRGDYQYDQGKKDKPRPSLVGQAKNWQTPSAADTLGGHEKRGGERGDELLLKGQAKAEELWATPNTVDAKQGNRTNSGQHAPESPSTSGKKVAYVLSAKWVSQLQGLPSDWCDLETETLSRLSGMR